MFVELTLATPEDQIGENAKICYSTKAIEDGGKDITKNLVHGHSHLAALRFAYATFHIEGISVACQNQFVRSKHLDFMVQSKRYVDSTKGGFEFIMPEGLSDVQIQAMQGHWSKSIKLYKSLIDGGCKKEDARAILPANTSTKMNVTGNLQAWHDFMVLRLNSHAQGEINELANKIYSLLQTEYPQVFTDTLRAKLKEGK